MPPRGLVPFSRAAWRAANREKIRGYFHEYRKSYDRHGKEYLKRAVGYMITNARLRARRSGVPFTITSADVAVPLVCPVLGIPLAVSRGHVSDGSPSLDRLIPSLGYVPGNVAVISFRANTIKSNATPDELRKVAEYIERNTKQ